MDATGPESPLRRALRFVEEAEKLKLVYRQNRVTDLSRSENSAEHSWHIALMAIVLAGHADAQGLDLLKIVKMLLVHDLVEIDVGDTFLYDAEANRTKQEREAEAAERIFGLLPAPLSAELLGLWREFENRRTPDAKFAAALDSLQPLMNHLLARNTEYREKQVRTAQVIEKKKHIAEGSAALWDYAREVIQASEDLGLYLK